MKQIFFLNYATHKLIMALHIDRSFEEVVSGGHKGSLQQFPALDALVNLGWSQVRREQRLLAAVFQNKVSVGQLVLESHAADESCDVVSHCDE